MINFQEKLQICPQVWFKLQKERKERKKNINKQIKCEKSRYSMAFDMAIASVDKSRFSSAFAHRIAVYLILK